MSPVIAVMIQALSEQLGMFGLIVDATHQSIFDAHAAFRSQIVVVCGVKHLRSVETFVHWNKLISQFIVRGMQRHGQTHRNALSHKFLIPGTTPTVETVMLRAEIPKPSGGMALI